uniref:T9SS type A sorting domain-containing protein n=1 Tax=Fulvivirga sp. TaxID=1931237 RepID=UPI00404B4E8D
MKRVNLLLLISLIVLTHELNGATYTLKSSCTSGCDWDQKENWVGKLKPSGNIPAGSTIIIPEGTTVYVRGGGDKITINNAVTLNVFGIINFIENSSQLNLSNSASIIQLHSGGDIITSATGQSETIKIGSGSIKGDNIDALLSPNVITETTLNTSPNRGCAEQNNCSFTPLPIKLIEFKGYAGLKSTVRLEWSTASEENFSYFELARSTNGIDFDIIGTIRSTGNNTTIKQNYSFEDKSPRNGIDYYQLTSVDFDGYRETFDVIAVQVNQILKPQIFPNPVSNQQFILNGMSTENLYSLYLIGLDGKVNFSVENTNDPIVDIYPHVTPAIYIVRVVVGDQTFTQRIVVR